MVVVLAMIFGFREGRETRPGTRLCTLRLAERKEKSLWRTEVSNLQRVNMDCGLTNWTKILILFQ